MCAINLPIPVTPSGKRDGFPVSIAGSVNLRYYFERWPGLPLPHPTDEERPLPRMHNREVKGDELYDYRHRVDRCNMESDDWVQSDLERLR
jgi:hypothetical protein